MTVHDYRTIVQGANTRYVWVSLLWPLMPQYWVRWLTVEARIDWEVTVTEAATGRTLARGRHRSSTFKTVRLALPRYFQEKLLRILLKEASPKFVYELFLYHLAPLAPELPPATGPGT